MKFILLILIIVFIGYGNILSQNHQFGLQSSFNWRNEIGLFYLIELDQSEIGVSISYSSFTAGIADYSQLPFNIFYKLNFNLPNKMFKFFGKISTGYEVWTDKPIEEKNLYYKKLYEPNFNLGLSSGFSYYFGDNYIFSAEFGGLWRNTKLELQESLHATFLVSFGYRL